ncbi:hypothetical protein EIKCOROL_02389 [Eikenella corrodens ATCC 23834]|uniref:Uncharacterized protein n=1 Tax=Eikenella corrodens ATCC 23834 TaxID=546274 RepID=C0DYC5_EIKCO|nr:hypothetical protein EIKCOROL_02389 [Eikenella corrodens ATCC 23834]
MVFQVAFSVSEQLCRLNKNIAVTPPAILSGSLFPARGYLKIPVKPCNRTPPI